QIAKRILNAREEMLQQRRVPKNGWTMPDPAVKYAAFLVAADPAPGKNLFLGTNGENAPGLREPNRLHIDAQQHMQMVAQSGFLKLKSLIRDLERPALKCGVKGTGRVIDLHRHHFAVPGMSAIFGSADHLPERGPLIIFRILHKGRYRI